MKCFAISVHLYGHGVKCWYMLVYCMYIMRLKKSKQWTVPTVVGRIVVVGVLTCALLHFLHDLEAIYMNVQHSLIREVLFYKFEAAENICCVNSKAIVHHNTVTKWFKKFWLGCKTLDNQARSGRPKTLDLDIISFMDSAKASGSAKLYLMLPKYCKTFDSP